jgi:hypothetical protein
MSMPRHVRARVTIANGKITRQAVEAISPVVKVVDGGYVSAGYEWVRDLTEEEMEQLNISFTYKVGDNI